jgi:tetratricopeptide (TPR) repeat protein
VNSFVSKRLFISYGHDEHTSLAHRLREDLNNRGHEVWFDDDRLNPGLDWECFIEKGLEHLAADKQNAALLLLLTPHAVRRPDGFCLNEVARALNRGLRIIPLMVVESEPPLSICRIQWLDMRNCFPIQERENYYRPRFSRLLRAVEEGELDFEGNQQRLLRVLQPLEFDADTLLHLPKFTGRNWVFAAIQQWLEHPRKDLAPKHRVFWISGGPGVGKTALSAVLSSRYLEVAALHLCKFGHTQKSDPRRVVMSIVYQLTTQLPEYEAQLGAMDIELLTKDDARTLFDNLLVQPLNKLSRPNRVIIILIDALDEATRDGRNELASFIAAEFHKTPDWLRLIITSRPEKAVTAPLQGLNPFILNTEVEENRNDLREYLGRELASVLQGRQDCDRIIEHILARSEGVFLYIERVCDDLRRGNLSLDQLDRFPQGLGGVFWQFFERQFSDIDWFKKNIRPALRAVLAAREPLPLQILKSLFGWSGEEKFDFTRALGSLFPVTQQGGNETIKPYHKALVDWLENEATAGAYYVSVTEGHSLLGGAGRKAIQSTTMDPQGYYVRHTLYHLQQCDRDTEAANLAGSERFRLLRLQLGLKSLFLSYSLDALEIANQLCGDLERLGHNVWRRRESGWIESEWSAGSADVVIALMSTQSIRQGSLSFQETSTAVSDGKIVLPVKAQRRHLPVPLHLSRRQAVDLSASYEVGLLEVQRFLEGRESVRQTALVRQREFGADDLRTLESFQELAALLVSEGMLGEAEGYYKQVLEGRKRHLGESHLQTLNTMRAIAGLRVAQGNIEEARKIYADILAVRESTIGIDQPETLESVYELAEVLEAMGQSAEAEPLYRRALIGFERVLGPDHPSVAQSVNRLAAITSAQGKFAEAEILYRRALELREKSLGPTHRDTIASLDNLGLLLLGQGRYQDALSIMKRSVGLWRQLLGNDSGSAVLQRDIGVSQQRIGDIYKATGDLGASLSYYRDSHTITMHLAQADPGNEGWQRDLAILWIKIGEVLMAQDNLLEALKAFRDSRAIFERLAMADPANAGSPRDLSVSWIKIGEVLMAQGNLLDAQKAFRDSHAILERLAMAGPANASLLREIVCGYRNIGDALRKQGKITEAALTYTSALAIMEKLAIADPTNDQWHADLAELRSYLTVTKPKKVTGSH